MCSAAAIETPSPIKVVDISSLEPRDLELLWEREANLWLEKLYWDVSPALDVVRRAVERRSLAGKAVREGSRVLGYSYYILEGHRAVLGSLVFSPKTDDSSVGKRVLGSLLASIQNHPSVRRIESQFIDYGLPWLSEFFRSRGFTEYSRSFLRRPLDVLPLEIPRESDMFFEICSPACLTEAAYLMQEAHEGSIDAEMNELYRTRDGCRALLDNILQRRGCGDPIASASFVARDRVNGVCGVVLATEISPGHAHLAQVAVSPAMQGKGLGRLFLHRSLAALASKGLRTVSLMVSGANHRAYSLYQSLGFREVLCFPVFSWNSMSQEPRSH
jgi:ribosomal protein S18 acetylase RimI-like enzyme